MAGRHEEGRGPTTLTSNLHVAICMHMLILCHMSVPIQLHSLAFEQLRFAFAQAGCRLSSDNNCSQHLHCACKRSAICSYMTNCCCVAACHKHACWVLTWLQLKLTVGARCTPSRVVQSDLMRNNAMGKVSIVRSQLAVREGIYRGDVAPGHYFFPEYWGGSF